jgi:hypothetical protein
VVATGALRAFGPDGLWLFFIAVCAGFAVFVVWRALQRTQPAPAMQEEFRALPASPRLPEWNPAARHAASGDARGVLEEAQEGEGTADDAR